MAFGWSSWIKHDGSGNPAKKRKVFVYWAEGDYDEYKNASAASGWKWCKDDLEDETKMCITKYRLWGNFE